MPGPLDELSKRVDRVNVRIDRVEDRLSKVEERLSRVESKINIAMGGIGVLGITAITNLITNILQGSAT